MAQLCLRQQSKSQTTKAEGPRQYVKSLRALAQLQSILLFLSPLVIWSWPERSQQVEALSLSGQAVKQEPTGASSSESLPVTVTGSEAAPSSAGSALAGLATLAAGAQLPKRLGNCLYDISGGRAEPLRCHNSNHEKCLDMFGNVWHFQGHIVETPQGVKEWHSFKCFAITAPQHLTT